MSAGDDGRASLFDRTGRSVDRTTDRNGYSMTQCARCGARDADRKMYPPREWVEYLQFERELSRPEGVLAVPLCGRCNDRLTLRREAFRNAIRAAEKGDPDLRERTEAVLDELDLDAVRDETGPAPDDVRAVL